MQQWRVTTQKMTRGFKETRNIRAVAHRPEDRPRQRKTPEDSSVRRDTATTETSPSGCRVGRPGTPNMSVTHGAAGVRSENTLHDQTFYRRLISHPMNLPAEKYPKDTSAARLLPPTYNVPPALHVELVSPSHRCRRNQPNKGPTEPCC